MSAAPALELAAAHLRDPSSAWSIGAFGVLAEFAWEVGEPRESEAMAAITTRGAIRVAHDGHVRALAYEALSAQPGLWHHGVLFCLPQNRATTPERCVITEVGPDREAIRGDDQNAILFDLGLGAAAFDFCVRTGEPALIALLRRACGSRLLDSRHDLARALADASPHRVAMSQLARIEVYQRIAPPDGATPTGPHTHFIPRLLRPRLVHSANIALPAGYVPGLALYPAHPAKDEKGRAKPYARNAHAAFQSLLSRFGNPDAHAAKAALLNAIARGESPASWTPPTTRSARQACRIAVRQLRQLGECSPTLGQWERALESAAFRRAA